MEAIVLAGGFGTRLRQVVPDLPKPMAPVAGRPFLAFLLEYLETQGIREVILSVGYRHEVIREFFGTQYRSIILRYSIETEPLGTGGGLRQSLELAPASPLFVINGDTFLKMDYQDMMRAHEASAAAITLALRQVEDTSRYGAVEIQNDRIVRFIEKGDGGPGWINSGVYLLPADLFRPYDLPKVFSLEDDFLYPFIEQLQPAAYCASDYFIDIGSPEEYQRAQEELPKQML